MNQVQTKGRLDQFAQQQSGYQSPALQGGGSIISPETNLGAQRVAKERDDAKIMEKIKVMARVAGSDWYYRFPVKSKNGQTSYIEGPSIKLAMSLSRIYGNCTIDCRVVDGGDVDIFYARFVDIETGFQLVRPFQQRKNQKTMGDDDARQRDIAFQIGASKAIRNVVVNSLRDLADFGFEEAKKSLVETIGKDIENWRQRVSRGLADHGIEIKRAERVLGRVLKEWTASDVAKVIALAKAVDDGMTTWADAFPIADEKAPAAAADAATTTEAAAEDAPEEEAQDGQQEAAGGQPEKAAADTASETKKPAEPPAGPTEAEIAEARSRGAEARRKKVSYRAVPPEYRAGDKRALATAWQEAWQEADKAFHAGENQAG